jgi:hypothetical protein
MEAFAPNLRETVVSLANALRFVVFFVCTAGLMLHVHQARPDLESLTKPIIRAVAVIAMVVTLPFWFGLAERVFLSLADQLHEGYTEHPMRVAAQLRETVADPADEWSFRRIGESLYKAFLFGAAKLIVLIASLLQLPFLLLQYLLKLLCYLFLPVALGLMMVPSLASLGTRYVQQTLAVLAWPVGFAVTELVAYHLLTAYGVNLAAAYDLQPGEISAASFGSLLGGLLAALWLVVGTLATPFLMQALICSGSPLSFGGQAALQQVYAVHQVAWLLSSLKTGGAAAAARGLGASASHGGTPRPPPPPTTPPAPPAPATPPMNSTPAGLLPAPHTTL